MKMLLPILLLLAATPALARDPARVLMPTDPAALAQQTQFGYAEAVIAGDTVYLSGVIVAPAPGETGLQPAYDRAFRHIAGILKRAGANWDDVVDLTSFHTNLGAQIADMAAVKDRYVKAPFPAWTAIGITALFEPTGVTEIKEVAKLPKK
ncbi:MAG: Rid family hydrolase [Polymorphobacter sp.]